MPDIEVVGDGVRIRVRVQPRASRTEVAGEHGDAWKVRVAAPPVDGAAIQELLRFLAKRIGVPPSRLRFARGERSRVKVVEIEGVDPDRVRERLSASG